MTRNKISLECSNCGSLFKKDHNTGSVCCPYCFEILRTDQAKL